MWWVLRRGGCCFTVGDGKLGILVGGVYRWTLGELGEAFLEGVGSLEGALWTLGGGVVGSFGGSSSSSAFFTSDLSWILISDLTESSSLVFESPSFQSSSGRDSQLMVSVLVSVLLTISTSST